MYMSSLAISKEELPEKLNLAIFHHAEIYVNRRTRALSSSGSNNLKLMKNQVSQWGLLAKQNFFLQEAIVSWDWAKSIIHS